MPLSDLAVKKARPRDRAYKIADERGLYMLVTPQGSKLWRLDFRLEGKRRTMGFGAYPDVELTDARDRRDEARKLIAAGLDPVRERKQAAVDDYSFKSFALRFLDANRPEWEDVTYGVLKRRLERTVFPEIGGKDIRTIEPTDMLDCIRKIEGTGTVELPRRMNDLAGRIFRFAIAEGVKGVRNPAADIVDALKKKPPSKRRAFIRPEKMGEFLAALMRDDDDEPDTVDVLLLAILTAGRTDEVRFAHVSEFEKLGTPDALWRLSPERMKQSREHLVPLSRQADELVRRRIDALKSWQNGLLFGRRTRSGVVSENTALYCLYRLGYRSRATVHGFRTTFSTAANAAKWDVGGRMVPRFKEEWIEWALSHTPENKVRAVYNANLFLEDRRILLQWWADWLEEQEQIARLIG